MNNFACLFVPVLAMSACTNSYTHSDFQTPSSSGEIATSLDPSLRGNDINATGDGYAYAVGAGSFGNLYAAAGIVPTTSVSLPLSAGTATWSGTYELARIHDISKVSYFIFGTKTTETNALTLTADFDNRTLTGGTALLTVNGAFTGSNLTGNVTYRGLDGPLTGLVGATGAVGAFHGDSARDIYAGGFIVGAP